MLGQVEQLEHILHIAHIQARREVYKLLQPAGLLVARAKVARAIHLLEEELANVVVLPLAR